MESLSVKSKNPVVVVNDVHVTYKVFGTGKRVGRSIGSWVKRAGVREIHAVSGVSLVVLEGETIGLIGSNGSGKSSLLRAIAGLEPPTKGSVYATSTPSMLGVGAALLPNLSGEKNIVLGALALGFRKQEIESASKIISAKISKYANSLNRLGYETDEVKQNKEACLPYLQNMQNHSL
jgi:teichoic acid transport system ATP-binding protein